MNIKQMSDEVFFERFKASVSAETNAIAEVVEYVREADARRLYLKFGCTSLFQFLTEHLGYAAKNPRYLPAKIKASVREDQHGCQWKHDGKLCGSKFQLEFDHIQPLWAGGASARENLQLLCGVHNRMKYRCEAGIRPVGNSSAG